MQYPYAARRESSRPTAVMLSHLYGAKDIVTAIRAARLIITQYGVYGKPAVTLSMCNPTEAASVLPLLITSTQSPSLSQN